MDSVVLCVLHRVKEHKLLQYSPRLKNTRVRQLVLDKWFPLSAANGEEPPVAARGVPGGLELCLCVLCRQYVVCLCVYVVPSWLNYIRFAALSFRAAPKMSTTCRATNL